MEWIGTHFVLTLGGVRLRVRIALEDTPDEYAPAMRSGERSGSRIERARVCRGGTRPPKFGS